MNDIEQNIRNIRPKGLSSDEREIMWSRISITLPKRTGRASHAGTFARKAIGGLLALSLVGGSVATVYASNDALPGDILFPVDLAAEKVQIVLSSGKNRDTLRIKFAEERLTEVKRIVTRDRHGAHPVVSAPANASTTSSTGTSTSLSSTSTPTNNVGTEKAFSIALAELERSRTLLANSGNEGAAMILDDIIADLQSVANDSQIVIKINRNQNHIKIALSNSEDASTTKIAITTSGKNSNGKTPAKAQQNKNHIRIEENGTRIDIKTSESEADAQMHTKNKHEDDEEDEENDDDHASKGKEQDDHNENNNRSQKISLCHVTGSTSRTIRVARQAARAHLAHGDTIGACTTATDPNTGDTAAPVLSGLLASQIGTSSATISWNTSENADGKVWFSVATPVDTTGSGQASASTLTTTHQFVLIGLSPNTTYHFVVASADAAGNRSTSTSATFTTAALPIVQDTTAPVLSALTTSNIATSSATISWTTNESSDARIWFGTSTPVDTVREADRTDSVLATSHQFVLTGLSPNTAYHFVVASTDAAGNRATSTSMTFMTSSLPPPTDTTAPTVSIFEATMITASSTTIRIETNEAASAVLRYSVAPFDMASSTMLSASTLALTHEFSITALTATTTYAVSATVTDAAGNAHTVPSMSFTTTGL